MCKLNKKLQAEQKKQVQAEQNGKSHRSGGGLKGDVGNISKPYLGLSWLILASPGLAPLLKENPGLDSPGFLLKENPGLAPLWAILASPGFLLKEIQAWIPLKRKPGPGVDVYFWAA